LRRISSTVSEDDQCLGAGHPTRAPDPVDDVLEMPEVLHPDPGKRIGITGGRERLDHLGYLRVRALDVVNLSLARKPKFNKCLDEPPELGVIDLGGVAGDDVHLLESIYAPLGGRRREAYSAANLACRSPPVLGEELKDQFVSGVNGWSHGDQIVTLIGVYSQRLCSYAALRR
jgi:hypothetical protein